MVITIFTVLVNFGIDGLDDHFIQVEVLHLIIGCIVVYKIKNFLKGSNFRDNINIVRNSNVEIVTLERKILHCVMND